MTHCAVSVLNSLVKIEGSFLPAGVPTVACPFGSWEQRGVDLVQVRIVQSAFEIIHLLTDTNPVQVLVDAIINRCVTAFLNSAERP